MPNLSNSIELLFAKTFEDNLYKVRYYAYSYLENEELAENIAQEAFLQLWQNKEKLNWSESVLPYLLTVTRNLCLNVIRKEKYHRDYVNYSKAQIRESLNYTALLNPSSVNLYSKEVEKLLAAALAKMDERVAETFKLIRLKGLSYTEAAKMQNVSKKTIESRITIALKILRKVFKDYLVFLIGILLH